MDQGFIQAERRDHADRAQYEKPLVNASGEPFKRGDALRPISRSDLVEIARNPRRWLAGYKPEQTASMGWGTDLDALVLTPQDFDRTHVVAPATYETDANVCPKCGSASDSKACRKCGVDRVASKVRKDWTWQSDTCREWREQQEQAGRKVLSADEYEKRMQAVGVIQRSASVGRLLACSQTQVALAGQYAVGDRVIPVRALLDIVPDKADSVFGGMLFDMKTSYTADPSRWARVVVDHSLHVQAAFYLDLYNAATGEEREDFAHVVQERFFPFELMQPFGFLAGSFIEEGRAIYKAALELYAHCLSLPPENWPGYARQGTSVALPEDLADLFQQIAPPQWFKGRA